MTSQTNKIQTAALSRRERDKFRQRQEIMVAAFNLFSEKGYYNVSIQEIAEKAEFAVGTLYKFFKSKDDLYSETMLEHMKAFRDKFAEVLGEPLDDVEKLRNFVRAKGEHFRENAGGIRTHLEDLRLAPNSAVDELQTSIQQFRRQMLEKIAAIFENGMKSGRFRRIGDPFYLAASLDSIIHAFLILWLEEPEKHPFPEDPDIILNIIFKGLIVD